MKKLTIIIPVYNEEHTIKEILTSVTRQNTPEYSKEIIIVDDGSTDRTPAILKHWKKKCKILSQDKNCGKGSAIQRALKETTGEIVIIQDADLEYYPSDYPVLLAPFNNEQISIVYGSRFLGPHLSTMYVYALGNKFVTFITNILYNTNITDMETGYKVFRKSVLTGITLNCSRFDFEPEFTAKVLKKGYQIFEVPISYLGRKFTEGKKLTWRDGIIALMVLIKYRFVN